jgi:alkanesulfonate monooxygenase SsuD/methylene tetrahydromethanopterin reductase-like flavin-dependent oxidoreductase (luciferase family)
VKFGIAHLNANWHDWDRHLAGDYGSGAATPDHQLTRETFELTDRAEELGFDSVWSPEHHFDPYCMAPDVLQMLSYYAGRNKKMDVASMVVVLPWSDPIRVAEKIALLDIMLEPGREFIIGFGRGLARHEFERFRIPMDTSRDRFKEAFEIIRLALTQDSFTYDGKFFQMPETSVRPQPKTKNLMDRVYISSVTAPSIQLAAEVGAGLMIIPQKPWDDHIADLKFYNRTRGEAGMAPRNPVVGCNMYCAETEEEAEEGYTRWVPEQTYSGTKHYEFDDPNHFQNTAGYEQYAQRAEERVASRAGERPSHEETAEGRALWHTGGVTEERRLASGTVVGTPEQCLEKIRRAVETTAPSHMFGFVRFGGMPYDKAKRSMELIAKEVLPEVHKIGIPDPIL